MDLLASMDWRRDLPPNVTACLRAVTALLNPPSGQQNANNGTAGGGGTHQSTVRIWNMEKWDSDLGILVMGDSFAQRFKIWKK
jgi:hypothetical protein